MDKRLINEMNKISLEIDNHFHKKKWLHECNLMGCRNKPIHKLQVLSVLPEIRYIYSCKKHRADFGKENYKEVVNK